MVSYREYVESGSWKCEKSPTGAHHWLCAGGTNLFYCKWCLDAKRFPVHFQDALRIAKVKKEVKDEEMDNDISLDNVVGAVPNLSQ